MFSSLTASCGAFSLLGTCFHQDLDQRPASALPPTMGDPMRVAQKMQKRVCCEGNLGSLVMHLEGRQQRLEDRKVGTCPGTSSYRMTSVTSSFPVCLQPFLVVLAAGPPPTLRSLLPLRSVPRSSCLLSVAREWQLLVTGCLG